jgi:catechol 2,3-dioxygenase-like lactoylglutathione lyase family enzyme
MHTTRSFQIKKMSPQLLVADVDRAIEFYTKKLGFDIDFRYEDFYAGIVKDGHSIHLKADKAPVEERKNRRKHDDLEITFLVDDIESLYKDLSSKSVEFSQSLRDMPYGKEFYVADPDNNIISFLEV